MRRAITASAFLSITGVVGCASTSHVWWTNSGFRHPEYGYEVAKVGERHDELLPPGWDIVNFGPGRGYSPVPRKGGDFVSEVTLDSDQDGRPDLRRKILRYDLKLQHRSSFGAIWVSSFPIEHDRALREPSLLVREIATSIGGSYAEGKLDFTTTADVSARAETRERRFKVNLISESQRDIAGRVGASVLIEVVDQDASEKGSGAVTRVELVLVRTDNKWPPGPTDVKQKWPLYVLFGYSNSVETFERYLPAFEELLTHVRLL